MCSSWGPTTISAHMLNTMSAKPRVPPDGATKADVSRRYHWPAPTPIAWPRPSGA